MAPGEEILKRENDTLGARLVHGPVHGEGEAVSIRGIARVSAAFACVLASSLSLSRAQEIEPRAYSNAPVGVNFLITGATYSSGALIFDPSAPLTDAKLRTPAALLAYAHAFDLWGKNARLEVIVPYSWLSGSAKYLGEPVERTVNGFADPRIRLGINFFGAPALSLKEFAAYQQDLIVGASVQVSVPVGQYDPTRLVNIGTNRWSLKFESGLSKVVGHWTLEAALALTFYQDNDDFFGGLKREQDPLYAWQGHLVYGFRKGMWIAVDATYYTGGRTTLDGVLGNDLQRNWRGGVTFAIPIDRKNSVKLYASSGVSARTGNDYDLYGAGWQYRWGGGL